MNAIGTAAVCLTLTGIAMAEPAFRIGTKLTWRSDAGGTVWHDEYNAPVAVFSYGEEFGGVTVELSYGPIWGISGRIDLAQLGVPFDGQIWRILPTGLDLAVEPPVDWRARPYVWGGGSLSRYVNTGKDDFMPDATHLRAGLGAKVDVSRRVELLAEAELFDHFSPNNGYVQFANGGRITTVETTPADLRLAGFEIGARIALGK